ncbi:uncharacterized protein HHUB_3495 [Halobacterium hubeiense]|uniref:Uncharacterized protein n=1 Tax=Halobacterium hubeiense TaxID=1407499 RepID=A0A0U5D0V2_9EURY|nr:uncharacterized protein HHUB_3495 [Halobacterium hubeiense]
MGPIDATADRVHDPHERPVAAVTTRRCGIIALSGTDDTTQHDVRSPWARHQY